MPPEAVLHLAWYEHEGYLAFGIWRGWPYIEAMCLRALRRLEAHPAYKLGFNISASTFTLDRADNGGRLCALFADWLARFPGRLSISGGDYAQPLANFIGDESSLRHFQYGLEDYREILGLDVPVWMASEDGNTPQLPQILAGFGYRQAIFRTHYTAFGGVPEFDASRCRWLGPDGSAIEAIPMYEGQLLHRRWLGIDGKLMSRFNEPGNSLADLDAFRADCQRRGIDYVFASKDDDAFAEAGDQLAAATEGQPGFRWVTAEEMFAIIPPLGEVRNPKGDDFRPDPEGFWTLMPWGSHGNRIFQLDRASEGLLLSCEALRAMGGLLGLTGTADEERALDQAWRLHLAGQNHDLTICYMLATAEDFDRQCRAAAEPVLRAACERLAAAIDTSGGEEALLVVNPLGWARSDRQCAELHFPAGRVRAFRLVDGAEEIPCEILACERHADGSLASCRIGFCCRVPACGWRRLSICAAEAETEEAGWELSEDASGYSLLAAGLRLRLAKTGGIEWVEDAPSGQRLLTASGGYTATIEGEAKIAQGSLRLTRRGWLSLEFVTEGRLGEEGFRQILTVHRDEPLIEVASEFTLGERRIFAPEGAGGAMSHEHKLNLQLSHALTGPLRLRRQLPFLVTSAEVAIDEGPRHIDSGAWIDLAAADGAGLALINRGEMGYLAEGSRLANILHYNAHPKGHLNVRPQAGPGHYRFSAALLPHAQALASTALQRRAQEYNVPCLCRQVAAQAGRLPPVCSLLDNEDEGAVITALFARGGAIHARLAEYEGRTARIALCSDQGPIAWRRVAHDLTPLNEEAPLGQLRACGIETLRLVQP